MFLTNCICYCIVYFIEWKEILNASSAATLFRRRLLREQELETPIRFSIDIETDVQDREAAVIAFYKQKRTTWAAPLHCVLEGRNIYLSILYTRLNL